MRFCFTKSYQNKNEKRKKFRCVRNRVKTAEVRDTEQSLVNSKSYKMTEFTAFIQQRSRVHTILKGHYANTLTIDDNNQYGLHRKLVADNREKFPDATYVMGNWPVPMVRFQEPTRGLGFRRLVRKHGFNVFFLIDEYKTSKICPECHDESATPFKRVPNPRPQRRHQQ